MGIGHLKTDEGGIIDEGHPLHVTSSSGNTGLQTYSSSELEKEGVVSSVASTLYGVDGFTQITGFLQLFDSATVPVNGSVPKHSQPISINEAFSYDPPNGVDYTNGISFAISSTVDTLTIIATDDALVYAYYV